MKTETTVTASTIEEAIEKALEQLGVQREEVEIDILEEPTKKLFGENTEARVRVSTLIDEATGETEEEGAEESFEDADAGEEGEETSPDEEEPDKDFEDEPSDEADPSLEDEKNFNEIAVQLSEEELDTIADTTIEVIHQLLRYFGADNAEIDEYEGEEGELIFDIVGDNLAVLIGRHGKTLDSFQFLVSSIVGKKTGYRHPVIVDVEGYKHRRKQKLVSIAKSSATRAIREKHEVKLRPMSPYERRIIHVALKDDKRITTHSDGVEPARYVIVRPV
jgi:spoIIIJ-associated protein